MPSDMTPIILMPSDMTPVIPALSDMTTIVLMPTTFQAK
jgi:hypothetical protein